MRVQALPEDWLGTCGFYHFAHLKYAHTLLTEIRVGNIKMKAINVAYM